jgi:hypothetical protein
MTPIVALSVAYEQTESRPENWSIYTLSIER